MTSTAASFRCRADRFAGCGRLWLVLALLVSGTPVGADVFTQDELRGIERRVVATIEHGSDAAVAIHIGDGTGSGAVLAEGLIASAAHVAGASGRRAAVHFPDGLVTAAETLDHVGDSDGGMLRLIKPGPWPTLPTVAEAKPMAVGDFVIALGHPNGFEPERPVVARLGRVIRIGNEGIQTDAALIAGDSGGPLLNLDGEVVGIHSRIGGTMRANYHVPIGAYAPPEPQPVMNQPLPRLDNPERPRAADRGALPHADGTDGETFLASFTPAIADAGHSVVEVRAGGKVVALGTVVGADGWVLTKAGELPAGAALTCSIAGVGEPPAVCVGIDRATDLALLHVSARALPPVSWADAEPVPGRWAIVPPAGVATPLAVGILSAHPRTIDSRAKMGVYFAQGATRPLVQFVQPDSGAHQAGLRRGDVIAAVAGQPTPTPFEVIDALAERLAGDAVPVTIERGELVVDVEVVLGLGPQRPADRAERMDHAAGPLSVRRSGFSAALQHDAPLRPEQCGGPLLSLDGQAWGINIARAGRVASLAIPAAEAQRVLQRLRAQAGVPVEGD